MNIQIQEKESKEIHTKTNYNQIVKSQNDFRKQKNRDLSHAGESL